MQFLCAASPLELSRLLHFEFSRLPVSVPFAFFCSRSQMSKIGRETRFLLFLGCIVLFTRDFTLSLAATSYSQKYPLPGVPPEDESFYKGLSSSKAIKCKDGSKKLDISQLNDDFCDCPDGSDEPGTSACPGGKFYCKNAGHSPLFLYSSRVNDGICDCCDGSDEYNSKAKCTNTCWEAGKVEREKLKKKIVTYKEGAIIRNQEIEQAKLALEKEEAQLSKLKNDEKILKALVETLKERKEQIEKAEEKERLEKEEKERKQADVMGTNTQNSAEDHESISGSELNEHSFDEELPYDGIDVLTDDSVQNTEQIMKESSNTGLDTENQDFAEIHHESAGASELKEHNNDGAPREGIDSLTEGVQNTEQLIKDSAMDENVDFDTEYQDEDKVEDTNSLSKEELGRLVASRWTGEKAEQQKEESNADPNKDDHDPDETPVESNYEEDDGYVTEYDDMNEEQDLDGEDHYQYDPSSPEKSYSDDELDDSDVTAKTGSSWLEKIQEKMKSVLQAINLFKTPVNISEAANVRKEYDDASAKLSRIQSKISSLSEKLKQDFGPEKEFYSFYGQCFESKQNKYVYKVCPFKQATQVEGYSTTRLGNWERFEDSYRNMKYEYGDKCWNGPDRSMKVKLRCGLKNELADVDEPSRCEYVALLSTPSLCVESKLKELQEKLKLLEHGQPQGHDEL